MPKKVTEANIEASAKATIVYEGGITEAIKSFENARTLAKQANDTAAIHTFNRLIRYCEDQRATA